MFGWRLFGVSGFVTVMALFLMGAAIGGSHTKNNLNVTADTLANLTYMVIDNQSVILLKDRLRLSENGTGSLWSRSISNWALSLSVNLVDGMAVVAIPTVTSGFVFGDNLVGLVGEVWCFRILEFLSFLMIPVTVALMLWELVWPFLSRLFWLGVGAVGWQWLKPWVIRLKKS